MSFHGFDPGDRNNWYQSPHLGLFPASPAASGGGISCGYYNSPYHSYGSSTCAFTQFSSPPNPYPPLQLNPSATIINGHMFPHQFPFIAQQPLTTTPRDPYIPTYHSPYPNPNLWVPLSISQSHSHEPSIPSVYSQFVPTNTMTTQPISHSASPPPTCGQPHTIADPKPLCPIPEYDRISLEPDRLYNWEVPIVDSGCYSFTPEHMTALTGAEKPQSPQRGSSELKVHKDHTNAKLCEMQTSFKSSMETFMSEFRGELRLLRSSQSPVIQVDNTPPTVATSLTASGKPSSSTTATSGGSIRISEPNFNLSPHEAILDLNNDISVVVVSGSSNEDNIVVGMTEKLVLNIDKNTAGGGTGMKFSGSHCSYVAKSILWKNNAQSHRFPHTNFGNGSSVGNLLLYCEVHTSMEVGNGFLDDNFGEENVSVEDSFEKMQMKSEKVLVLPMRKVMHGAGRYIGWFQRAFGIYICNLFDTGQASRVLKLERDILDYLLHHFFDVSARKDDHNTNGYYDHSSSSQSIIANVPTAFQCPKSGQKLIHMAVTPNYALKRLLHQCSRSWISTIIFIFFCISVEKAIADTMKLTSEFLVGCLDVIPAIKKYLNDKIEPWLAGIFCENGFLHDSDSKWAGIVTNKKLADLGANYNDHHYHLGYFIYVIPVTSKIDLAWRKKYMSQAYSLGQKLNIQQGSSYFGIVPVILKEVFSFSSEMHCFSLVPIIFNVGMVTTVQPFSLDWGFQVHQLWPPLMMMRCFSLPLSLLGNDYFKSTLLITAVTGFDVVALHFLCQTKASCHPRSFIVDEFFDFLKINSKLSFVRYTCDALLSSDNCVGFLTNMHKFFQHMVGHVHKDEFFLATWSSTSCPPFHALVKKLFLLSPVVAIHSLQPLLADILRDDAQLIFGIMMVVSMNELMFLRSKKQGLQIGYSDIDNGNYCPSMSCSLHLPHFMITWFFEFTSVAIDFGDLALIPPQYFSVPIILLFRVVHSQAIEFVKSSHILQGPNREALRTSATSHVGVHLCALLHTWQVTNDENEATAVAFALINSVVAVCIQLSSRKAAFDTDIYVASALVDMYSKCGLSLNFQEKEAFTYFEKMRQYEMFPTPFSYANLWSCCAKLASSFQEKQITTLTLMKISLAKVFEIESDGGLSHNLEKMCLLIAGHEWAADVISSDVPLPSVDDLADQLVEVLDLFGIILTTPTYRLSTPFVTDEWLVEADMIIKARQERRIVFAEVLAQFPFLICLRPEGMPYFKGGGMLGLLFYNYILSWANVLSYLSGLCFQLRLSMYIADWTRVGSSGKLVCLGMFANRAI
ncbi:putative endo-1,3(4)-beta-glucanase, ribonuclease H-like domain-containing protein [Rosa chinensis]|uniref:Putative endo-1,3(4)-beta-glucanase, ribonuclease H-like domain-containing protein n=1 Tax=Rosa chinensis TaxID=74649 RepID=A0A2P6QT94_ROSCH|nr:putative endo-1,3(4)-beta-glucanase, ribonuclease H-like domain-containing protein [Rosa chinensis]